MRAAILTACLALALPGAVPSRADDLRQRVDDLEMRLDDLGAWQAAPVPRLEMNIPSPRLPAPSASAPAPAPRAPIRTDEVARWSRETPSEWRGVPAAPKPLPEPTWYGNWIPRR